MWRWLSVLVVMCVLSYGYGIYSLINRTFPFKQVQAVKKALQPPDAAIYINPKAEQAAVLYGLFYKDADIAMVGDSITVPANWHEIFPDYNIVNRGVSGDTIQGVLNRVDDILLTTPKLTFVMVGINDIYGGNDVDRILETYTGLIEATSRKTKLYIQSTVSCGGELCTSDRRAQIIDLNTRLQALAAERGVTFIDLNNALSGPNGLKPEYTYDGIHLNGAGFKVWADVLTPYLSAANG